MKILSRTTAKLILVEDWPTMGHWGVFMLCLTIPALYLLLTDPRPKVLPGIWLSGFFFIAGFITAFFLNKRLRHVLDKVSDTLTVELPVEMNRRLEKETAPLGEITAVVAEEEPFDFLQGAERRGNYGRAKTGFCYILRDGRRIESGLYSSDREEINRAVSAIRDFLRLKET